MKPKNSQAESESESIEDIQARILADYKKKNKLNLGHRLSLLKGSLSDYLNVEYSFDQVAKSIHNDKRTNKDFSYWSAKLLQVNLFFKFNSYQQVNNLA